MNEWDLRYAEGDTPWDKGRAHPAIVGYVASHPLEGRILVPGCGAGHDVRAIATPSNSPQGLDISPRAIAAAKSFPVVANETFAVGDIFAMPEESNGSFDWVLEHTCLCAIDPSLRDEYSAALHRALAPGGQVLAVFFLDPRVEEGPPFGITIAELDRLFPGFEVVQEKRDPPTFPDRDGVELLRVLRKR